APLLLHGGSGVMQGPPSWIDVAASFEARLRRAPQDEDAGVLHRWRQLGGSPSSLMLRCSAGGRASKHASPLLPAAEHERARIAASAKMNATCVAPRTVSP